MDAVLSIDTVKNCKDWLAQLPLTNAQQAHSLLLAQMKLLNAAALAPADRLQILEALREPVAFVQGERAKRFSNQPVPLEPATAAIWNDVIALWFALVQGYQACAGAGVMHVLIHQSALPMPEDAPRGIPASLILAPTAYQSNRPVDLHIDARQSATLVSLLDKGVNFERATFVAG